MRIFDNTLEVTKDSDTVILIETPYPSPSCSINHLEYDCGNHFCPFYIKKENMTPFDSTFHPLSACISSCYTHTTMNNSLLTDVTTTDSPNTSDLRRQPKNDKGNVRKIHFNEWKDSKRKCLSNLGKQSITRKGKLQASRKMGPPYNCRKKCFSK